MKQMTENYAGALTIISEPGSLTFLTRKDWNEIPDPGKLLHHETVRFFTDRDSIYFLMRNMNPLEYCRDANTCYRLFKIRMRQDDYHYYYYMNLSPTEADALMRNNLSVMG